MVPLVPLVPHRSGAGRSTGQAAAGLSVLPELMRRAARIPSLAAKYAPHVGADDLPELTALPVLTQPELARATKEVLTLGRASDSAQLWADGGTLDSPALTLLPEGMFAPQIRRVWRPLGPADVLANLHPPGKLRPDHYFYNRFAAESGATTLAFGRLPDGNHDDWLDFFARHHVTAVAAPPETLRRLLGGTTAGRPVPWLRTLLLGGAACDPTADAQIAECFPYTDVWRLYGSPGAWVTGHRGPQCLADVYHPLPHQHVEIVDGMLRVTTLDVSRNPPLIRYQTQDRGEFARCTCGLSGPAVRVFGPASPFFRFHGRAVSARELVELATAGEEVTAAQVAVSGEQRIQLRVRLAPGVPDDHHTHAWIRFRVLESHLALAACVTEQPDLFEVVAVDDVDPAAAVLVSEEY
ncbi:AMP-binding protein [Streptomyces sp. NPDC048751]|uniref:AMP-binding protein n=1 Tax=Streptomyces sp. NPDC048751 TaxID=3365591 RepID=UPI00371339DB